MKLLSITLDGFLSFRECTTIELSELTFCAITGPNGSGKSSIVHGITWALYGDVRVANDKDSIVNDYENEVQVELHVLDNSNTEWSITRYKMWRGSSKLWLQYYDGSNWTTFGDHRNATSQQQIYQIVGLGEDAFYSLMVMDQSSTAGGTRFTKAGSNQRRDILMGMLPELSIWSSLADTASDRLSEIRSERKQIEQKIEYLESDLSTLDESLEEYNNKLDQYQSEEELENQIEGIEERIASIRSTIDSSSDDRNDLEARLKTLRAERKARNSEIQSRQQELQRTIKQVQDIHSEIKETQDDQLRIGERKEQLSNDQEENRKKQEELDNKYSRLRAKHDDVVSNKNNLERHVDLLKSRLDEAETRSQALQLQSEHDHESSGRCLVCNSPLDSHKLNELTQNASKLCQEIQDERDKTSEQLESLNQDESTIQRKLQSAEQEVSELTSQQGKIERKLEKLDDQEETNERTLHEDREALKKYTDLEQLQDQYQELEQENESSEESQLRHQVTEYDREHPLYQDLKQAQNDLSTVRSKQRELTELVSTINVKSENRKSLKQKRKQEKKDLKEIQSEFDYTSWVASACAQKGIPSMLLGEVLDAIEARQNEILFRLLGDQAMQVEFRTSKGLKSREGTKDVLDIVVHTSDGFEREIESFSFGEKVRLTLSNLFALVQVFNERNGYFIQSLFLDEPLGPLDENSIPALVGVLQDALNQEIVQNILVVTHDDRVIESLPQRMIVSRSQESTSTTEVVIT